jgi:hypothetical protein
VPGGELDQLRRGRARWQRADVEGQGGLLLQRTQPVHGRTLAAGPVLDEVPGHRVRHRHLGLRQPERGEAVRAQPVAAAFEETAARLRERLAQQGPATFYAWYDAQAGQLRSSLHSGTAQPLPFRCVYEVRHTALEIVRVAAADASPGVIPWAQLREIGPDEPLEPSEPSPPLLVWAVSVA